MRLIVFTYCFFALIFTSSIYIVTHTSSYEQSIIGQWEEVSWEFEKSDHHTEPLQQLDDYQKAEICKSMIIHQAEVWEFRSQKQISLYNKNKQALKHLEWTIKGRGNILEIQHADQRIENYQIQEIHNDTMVVHFNFDLQVRGIVKMTFKRIKPEMSIEYAAKTP